jgi:hypothetical protein
MGFGSPILKRIDSRSAFYPQAIREYHRTATSALVKFGLQSSCESDTIFQVRCFIDESKSHGSYTDFPGIE